MSKPINQALSDEKYLRTLQGFQDSIINHYSSIKTDTLKNNNIFKKWYDKLDAESKAKIDSIANLDGDADRVSKQELKTMLVLLDTEFTDENFSVDGEINVSEKTKIGNVLSDTIKGIYDFFVKKSQYSELNITLPSKYSDEALAGSYNFFSSSAGTPGQKTPSNDTYSIKRAQAFAEALEENKEELMADLNISSDEYDNLANIAMGIAEQETHFGDINYTDTNGSRHTQKRYILKQIAGLFGMVNSVGVTQIRYEDSIKDGDWVQRLCSKYGINSGNDYESNSKKAAIATIIILRQKQIAAQSDKWQKRIVENNANNPDYNTRITTDDITALLWNQSGKKQAAKFDDPEHTVTINEQNTNDEKNGLTYPRNVRAYREKFFGGTVTNY